MSTPAPAPHRYTAALAADIERRWQDRWAAEGTFWAPNPVGDLAGSEGMDLPEDKYFIMDMFPYPSGAGLHVGHPLGYIATDVVGRHKRMQGANVLHALGYDAFGLPAELHAVQTGEHPRANTLANIENMRRQLRRLGLGHDDRRSFATIDPDFVRWTQWIFLQVFGSWYDEEQGRARPIAELVEKLGTDDPDVIDAHRLAYVSESPVNWCPGLGTVLANEEVTAEGRSERGNFPVFTRSLRQWQMRITAYADRLVDDLDRVDWPEPVKMMQRNWIGRSHGAHVTFTAGETGIEVFTTRPDTLFGATYMVLAPESPLVDDALAPAWPKDVDERWTGGAATPAEAVAAYRARAAAKTDVERQENREKTGVFTGAHATNPVTGEDVPVFIADYVLAGYGTGAIMAVPAHDARDHEFARAFGLPIVTVVQPPEGHDPDTAFTGNGVATASANDDISLDGLEVNEAKAAIIAWLEQQGTGRGATTYRLRDWLFSRQRYWGEPFPIVYDEDDRPIAVPDHMLPVDLPEVPDYSPRTFAPDDVTSEPEPPLGRVAEWVHVELDLGDGPRKYRRETNTMPNWAGSSWYELRYTDPHNTEALTAPANEAYWLGPRGDGPGAARSTGGVDLYVGGVEHAVLHLLYARFWHKVLFDLGHVSSEEPFHRLFNQGYIQAYAYTDARGAYVPAEEVVEEADGTFTHHGSPVSREYGKMGKSLKNVVTPDDMYDAYGADTFRVYEMSMGPLDVSRPWETRAVVGAQRFLQRVWRLAVDEESGEARVTDAEPSPATLRVLHRTIDGVGSDMDGLRFNTAIAKLIELTNHLTKSDDRSRVVLEPLVLMLAPFAPHVAEELWARLGHTTSLTFEPWPVADPDLLVEDTVTCVVQVQGKVRAKLEVPPGIGEDELRELALAEANVQRSVGEREVRKVIVRAPRLVNVVV